MKREYTYKQIKLWCQSFEQPDLPFSAPIFILSLLANNRYTLKQLREEVKNFTQTQESS